MSFNNFSEENLPKIPVKIPSDFALECERYFPSQAHILELGSGQGRDALYFGKRGFRVTACDINLLALEILEKKIKEQHLEEHIETKIQDVTQRFDFPDKSFEVVYAHLLLHYFDDKGINHIIQEVRRVLKNKGLFCASAKSIKDPLYGQGRKISDHIYEHEGVVRHFLSEDYLRSKLKEFKILVLETKEEFINPDRFAFVKFIAQKQS